MERPALERALGAQYQVVRLLGRGGMGAVYLARDTALDRLVAIKVLPPETGDSAERRERFRREARTAARLNHPGIVPLYSYGELEDTLYFVMGYVRGESLAARLQRDGRLPASEARRLTAALADALDYAHQQGVVHRDVKPDNVLLDDESGRPLLADFGVAKARGSGQTLTESGSVLGTPHYMSPEQASGRTDVDGRSDLYSLGVIAYRMLAGRLPFEGKDPRDVLVKHLTQEPPPLRELAPDVPEDFSSAVMRCLAKESDRRWPDARRFAEAVRAGSMDIDTGTSAPWIGWPVLWCAWMTFLLGMGSGLRVRDFWVSPAAFVFLLTLPALVPLVGGYKSALQTGVSARVVAHAALRAPSWWIMWYPRVWRRPGDVWDRLPWRVRRLRLMVTALFAGLGLGVAPGLVGLYTAANVPSADGLLAFPFARVLIDTMLACLVLCAILAVELPLAARWAQRHGLDAGERHRLFFDERTAGSAFWARPQVNALLAPAGAPEPKTPPEHVSALESIVGRLEGSRRALAEEALSAARVAVRDIRDIDEELARLGTAGDAAAVERLESQIRTLNAPGDSQGHEAGQALRELLTRQLDATRAVAAHLEAVRARRRRAAERLARLWTEVRWSRAPRIPGACAPCARRSIARRRRER